MNTVGDCFIGEIDISSDENFTKENSFVVGKIIGRLGGGVLVDCYVFDFGRGDYFSTTAHCPLDALTYRCLFVVNDVWEKCNIMFKDREKVNLKLDVLVFHDYLNNYYLGAYETMRGVYGRK